MINKDTFSQYIEPKMVGKDPNKPAQKNEQKTTQLFNSQISQLLGSNCLDTSQADNFWGSDAEIEADEYTEDGDSNLVQMKNDPNPIEKDVPKSTALEKDGPDTSPSPDASPSMGKFDKNLFIWSSYLGLCHKFVQLDLSKQQKESKEAAMALLNQKRRLIALNPDRKSKIVRATTSLLFDAISEQKNVNHNLFLLSKQDILSKQDNRYLMDAAIFDKLNNHLINLEKEEFDGKLANEIKTLAEQILPILPVFEINQPSDKALIHLLRDLIGSDLLSFNETVDKYAQGNVFLNLQKFKDVLSNGLDYLKTRNPQKLMGLLNDSISTYTPSKRAALHSSKKTWTQLGILETT